MGGEVFLPLPKLTAPLAHEPSYECQMARYKQKVPHLCFKVYRFK